MKRVLNISNSLSFFRVLLIVPMTLALTYNHRMLAVGLALLAYLSDIADGYAARKLKQITDFGKIIDPVADKLFVGAVALTLLLKGELSLWFVIMVLLRDLLILCGGLLAARRSDVVLPSNYTGKAAVLAIGLVLMAVLLGLPALYVDILTGLSAILVLASLVVYGRRLRQVLRNAPPQGKRKQFKA